MLTKYVGFTHSPNAMKLSLEWLFTIYVWQNWGRYIIGFPALAISGGFSSHGGSPVVTMVVSILKNDLMTGMIWDPHFGNRHMSYLNLVYIPIV